MEIYKKCSFRRPCNLEMYELNSASLSSNYFKSSYSWHIKLFKKSFFFFLKQQRTICKVCTNFSYALYSFQLVCMCTYDPVSHKIWECINFIWFFFVVCFSVLFIVQLFKYSPEVFMHTYTINSIVVVVVVGVRHVI